MIDIALTTCRRYRFGGLFASSAPIFIDILRWSCFAFILLVELDQGTIAHLSFTLSIALICVPPAMLTLNRVGPLFLFTCDQLGWLAMFGNEFTWFRFSSSTIAWFHYYWPIVLCSRAILNCWYLKIKIQQLSTGRAEPNELRLIKQITIIEF